MTRTLNISTLPQLLQHYGLQRTTEPSEEPVTLAQAKQQLKLEEITDEDDLLSALITAAREYGELVTRRTFVTSTWTMTLDDFPYVHRAIELRMPPLASVTSITYIDTNGDSQTLAASTYDVDTSSVPGRVVLKPSESWPETEYLRANAVTIVYVAGYGDAGDVPQRLRQAVLLLAAHWFNVREAVTAAVAVREVPLGVKSLLTLSKAEGF